MKRLVLVIAVMVSNLGMTQTFDSPLNRPTASMQWYKGKDHAKCINGSKKELDQLFSSMDIELVLGEPTFVNGSTKTYKTRKDGFEYRIMYAVFSDTEGSIVVNRQALLYYEN